MSGIDNYDCYLDWNHPHTNHLFKIFDTQYPGSKFILTYRDLDSWLDSREKHVKRKPNLKKLQKKYPGSPWYNVNREEWKKEWVKHHMDVLSYFEHRPSDLLVMNICDGDGWEKLCPFLGLPIPEHSFPHKNKASWPKKVIALYRRITNL